MELAYAVVREHVPTVFAAEDMDVLHWVLAVHLVAQSDPNALGPEATAELRDALMEERWGDAVIRWMDITGVVIDVYPGGLVVYDRYNLSPQTAAAEMQFCRLFRD